MGLFKTDPNIANSGDASVASLTEAVALIQRQCEEILNQVNAMSEQLSQLAGRESELRKILERDSECESHLDRLAQVLRKKAIPDRLKASIDQAQLHLEPFPYTVIDSVLPGSLYDSLLRGLPPVELFTDKPAGKQQLAVPFSLAPAYSQRVWTHFVEDLIPNIVGPRLVEKFRAPIDDWISYNWPQLDPGSVPLRASGGRIMLRRRGYRIRPHRDPKWSFITCILYLARPGDDEAWGTQLYAVDGDDEAKNAAPYWIGDERCRLVEDVKFKPNRLLVFLNSVGAHGAQIPEDAQPENLERYIYQFRFGPTVETIAMLKSMLPEDRQALWAGKALVDY
jgi:hypothetical protein